MSDFLVSFGASVADFTQHSNDFLGFVALTIFPQQRFTLYLLLDLEMKLLDAGVLP
jgi:hypothetical protein